jgi:hypothetical protein
MFKTIQVGKTYNGQETNQKATILERNGNYCYTEQQDGSGKHLGIATVFTDSRGDEQIKCVWINVDRPSELTKEFVYPKYLVLIKDRDRDVINWLDTETRETEETRKHKIFTSRHNEVDEMKKALCSQLRLAVLESSSAKELLKDKKVTALLEQLAQVNTLLTPNIYSNF